MDRPSALMPTTQMASDASSSSPDLNKYAQRKRHRLLRNCRLSSSPRNIHRRRKDQAGEDEIEYTVRNIIDEDDTRYLIDWEDSESGQEFEPTWEPKEYANKFAVSEWERKKCTGTAAQSQGNTTDSRDGISTSGDSQPIRGPKRVRLQEGSPGVATPIPGTKSNRQLKAGTASTARFSYSQEKELSQNSFTDEIEDSFEADSDFNFITRGQAVASIEKNNRSYESLSSSILPTVGAGIETKTRQQPLPTFTKSLKQKKTVIPDSQEFEESSVSRVFESVQTHSPASLEESQWIVHDPREISPAGDNLSLGGTHAANSSSDSVDSHQGNISPAGRRVQDLSNISSSGEEEENYWHLLQTQESLPIQREATFPPQDENLLAIVTVDEPHTLSLSGTESVRVSCVENDTDSGETWQAAQPRSPVDQSFVSQSIEDFDSFSEQVAKFSNHHPQLRQLSLDLELPESYQTDCLPRHKLPAEFAMADQVDFLPERELTITEKLKQSRAAAIASSRASRASTVTPVKQPSRSPPAAPTDVQILPSALQDFPIASSPGLPDDLPDDDEEQVEELALQLPDIDGVQFVLLPMVSMVRDVYVRTVCNSKEALSAFADDRERTAPVVTELDKMLEDLRLICNHQDLVGDMTLTQSEMGVELQSKWAQNCSTKCLFLRELLTNIRDSIAHPFHIAIVVRSGRTLDIIEAILKAENFRYKRPDTGQPSPCLQAWGNLSVTLISSSTKAGEFTVATPDAIIVFDTTLLHTPYELGNLRSSVLRARDTTPIISLAIINSVEHIEHCLGALGSLQKKATLIYGAAQTRKRAGVIGEGEAGPDELAAEVSSFILDPSLGWPLIDHSELVGLAIPDMRSQLDSGSTTQSHDSALLHANIHPNNKRSFEEEEEAEDDQKSKRPRMSPIRQTGSFTGEQPPVGDAPGYSQSPSPHVGNTPHGTRSTRTEITLQRQIDVLERTLSDERIRNNGLRIELDGFAETKQGLEEKNKTLQKELDDYRNHHKTSADQFLKMNEQVGKLTHENAETLKKLEQSREKVESVIEELSKAREEKTALRLENDNLKALLLSHENPAIADFEKLKQSNDAAQAELRKKDERLESVKSDQEFIRSAYQNASSEASTLGNENADLRRKLEDALRRANDNKIRIHEMNNEHAKHKFQKLADIAEAKLEQREKELAHKSKELEELKSKSNGRRETRGTSLAPGSPRLGTAIMSPRPRGPRSRQGSPAPGELGRSAVEGNRVQFGDSVLFPAPSVGGPRYEHLREG